MLAKDTNLSVLFEVIENRKTFIKTLEFLEASSNNYVSEATKRKLCFRKKRYSCN